MTARTTCLSAALVGALLLVPSPAAARPGAADDRAAAREFAYAAYRLRVAVKAQAPQIAQAAAVARAPACRAALADPTQRQLDAHLEDLVGTLVDLVTGTLLAPVHDPLRTFQAELDRVPTRDPVLRSGRAAWRATTTRYAQVRPLPADLCARLQAWRRTGFAHAQRPRLQPPAVRDVLTRGDGLERKLAAAVRRLRELGVPAGQARRFGGDRLFDGVATDDAVGLLGATGPSAVSARAG